MADRPNVSADLVWEVARNNNAYLVKRYAGGRAVYFSRDPLNLTNKHSRTHAGFVNDKAIGIQPGPDGGVVVTSNKVGGKSSSGAGKGQKGKKGKKGGDGAGEAGFGSHRPATSKNRTTYGKSNSSSKIYKTVAQNTTKDNYRGDLRAAAVARVSAILNSQRPKPATSERKSRGKRAKISEK